MSSDGTLEESLVDPKMRGRWPRLHTPAMRLPSHTPWHSATMLEALLPGMCACRSPEKPGTMLIKRLLALEGDWVTIPGRIEVEKIPKVFSMLSAPGHGMLSKWYDQKHTEQVGVG